MNSEKIAYKIAWIKCEHKNMGMEPCSRCLKRYQRELEDITGITPVLAVAKFYEPKIKLEKITPLTWCQSYDIVKLLAPLYSKGDFQ